MGEAAKAVFLSYAREDAPAARRIAEALRSHGLKVWFDEDELRGGDSWDSRFARGFEFGVWSSGLNAEWEADA